jgi:hypothetical protein
VEVLDILQANYESQGPPIESVNTSLGIGKGWHPNADNPDLVEHEDDGPDYTKKFGMQSAYGRFIRLVSGQDPTWEDAVIGDGDGQLSVDLTGARAALAQKGVETLRSASAWDNMIFEYRGIGFAQRNNPKPRPKPLPTRYLGYSEDEIVDLSTLGLVSTNNPARVTLTALGPVTPEQVETWTGAGASGATVALLTRLWEGSASVDSFIRNAGMLKDVKENETLAKVVVDTPES